MGGPLEEGARRTRSSARVTASVPATPPSAKKPKVSTPSSSRRGRGKKDLTENLEEHKVIKKIIWFNILPI